MDSSNLLLYKIYSIAYIINSWYLTVGKPFVLSLPFPSNNSLLLSFFLLSS